MNINVRLALFFTLAIVLWFGSGSFGIKDSGEPVATKESSVYTKVQATNSIQQSFSPTIQLRAKTKVHREVKVLAEVSGKVISALVEEGAGVIAGQGICEIGAEDRFLSLAQAKAFAENADIAYRGALKLKSVGYQSDLAISQAKANQAAAKTNVKRAQLDVNNLKVKAPFDGIVESRPVEIGDFIMPGQLCAVVVELDPLKIEALVAETEINKLRLGDKAVVVIDGNAYPSARITYLARQANPKTRGYRLEATMGNPEQALRAGISARLKIETTAILAHLVPASSILLNDIGETVVRVLDQKQIVDSLKVTAVGESAQGIWVAGLPEKVVLVTVGQNYIIDGEHVEPSFAAASPKQ